MHTEMLKNWHQRLIYFHCIILYKKKNSIKVRLYAQKIRLKSEKNNNNNNKLRKNTLKYKPSDL